MSTLESILEGKLTNWAKGQGGIALKGATQFDTGYPDRVVYVPGAHAHVEVKGTSTRYHLSDKQKIWAGRIIASKSPYYIIESERQLERFKEAVYSDASALVVNEYNLNGDQLILHVDAFSGSCSVTSNKDGITRRIMTGLMSDTVAKTIYRVFRHLEEHYPNTNYEDI